MNATIRNAGKDDLRSILALQKLCYKEIGKRYDDFDLPPPAETLMELETAFSSQAILKAEGEGILIGSIRGRLENDTCHIGRLIVHPEYQNRGIGRELIRELESRFPALRDSSFSRDIWKKRAYISIEVKDTLHSKRKTKTRMSL